MENKSTNQSIDSIIGNRIKQERTKRGLSQTELGRLCSSSRASISCYERAQRSPDISILIKFAQIFNTSIDYLIGLTSNAEPDNRVIGATLGLSDNAIETLKELKENKCSYDEEVLYAINLLLDTDNYDDNINYFRNIYAFIKTHVKNDKIGIICNSSQLVDISLEDITYALLLSNNSYLAKLREKDKNERS